MGSSSNLVEIGSERDFEVIWINRYTNELKDLNDVTCEIYHFENVEPAKITSTIKEPYLITDGLNATLDVASYSPSASAWVETEFPLQLNIIVSQLSNINCPPNSFVVPYTNEKYSIQNNHTVFALSACEVVQLINLNASGYVATSENGYVVLTSTDVGSYSSLLIGNGSINSILGFSEGTWTYGNEKRLVYDLTPTSAAHISQGRYIWTEHLDAPKYSIGERYYILFKGLETNTLFPEIHEEDFTLINKLPKNLTLFAEFVNE